MTEKRFKLKEDYDWWGITDDTFPKTEYGYREDLPDQYISCDYCWNDLTHQEVVDLLNELYEENKLLRCTIVEILDFIEENNGVSLEEMKEWWKNKEKELQ